MDVRLLTRDDCDVFDHVADDVFDGPLTSEFIAEFLADERHAICVAISEGTVVGFASGVRYIHPDKPSEFWINEVGVAPPFQRRGLGKALLGRLLAHAKEQGCREAWLITDLDNIAARALYRSTAGEETPAGVMVTYTL